MSEQAAPPTGRPVSAVNARDTAIADAATAFAALCRTATATLDALLAEYREDHASAPPRDPTRPSR